MLKHTHSEVPGKAYTGNGVSPIKVPAITDFEVVTETGVNNNPEASQRPWWHNLQYLLVGVVFGIVFVKSEVISWFRIQEMFRLQSFHMYGVIGTAVVVGMISVWLIKKLKLKTIHGEPITFQPKTFNKGQIFGGLIFGFGWAMTGACPARCSRKSEPAFWW